MPARARPLKCTAPIVGVASRELQAGKGLGIGDWRREARYARVDATLSVPQGRLILAQQLAAGEKGTTKAFPSPTGTTEDSFRAGRPGVRLQTFSGCLHLGLFGWPDGPTPRMPSLRPSHYDAEARRQPRHIANLIRDGFSVLSIPRWQFGGSVVGTPACLAESTAIPNKGRILDSRIAVVSESNCCLRRG